MKLTKLRECLIELRTGRQAELIKEMESPNYHPFSYIDGYIRGKIDLLNSLIDSSFTVLSK